MLSMMLSLLPAENVSAGWLSWDAGFLTGVAAANALAPEPFITKGLATAAAIAEVAGLATDALSAAPQNNMPALAALPQPAADTAQASVFLAHVYPAIPLSGTPQDAAIMAGNVVITDFNTVVADINNGASRAQLLADVATMGFAMENMANQINLIATIPITQVGMNSFLSSVASSGLPSFESDYLLSAGWSQSDVNAMASYLTSQSFNLASSPGSITLGQALDGLASNMIPEPSAWLLFATGCAGMLGIRGRWRRNAATPPADLIPKPLVTRSDAVRGTD